MKSRLLAGIALVLCMGCNPEKTSSPEANTGGTVSSATASPTVGASNVTKPSALTSPTSSATTKLEQTTERVGAYKSATVGFVRVSLKKIAVGKVALKESDGTLKYTDEPRLMVTVRLENLQDKRQFHYETWVPDLDAAKTVAKMTDDQGKEVKRVTLGFGNNVKDRTVTDDIKAGKSATDLLLFEVPPAEFKFLNLDLPGANCGQRGVFQFRIEPSDITK